MGLAPVTELLDLSQVDLFGWESDKSFSKVARFVELIEAGVRLPHITVVKIEEEGYFLDPSARVHDWIIEDGGHHRAIAHYLANVPIEAAISNQSIGVNYFPNAHIHVRDIVLV